MTAEKIETIRGMRALSVAMQYEGAYQLGHGDLSREMFVALGLHNASQNVRLYQVQWKALGELNAHRAALAA